jgi:hypothetical protein
MGGSSKGGSGNEARRAREEEQARQARIREGTARIGGIFGEQFTPEYFDRQRDNYVAYATPQLEDQRADANKEMVFALDRGGQLSGSSRASLAGELQKKYELQRQKVADDALNYRTQAMNNVEGARTDLINTLNATGDAEGAATSAIARASALSQPANYSPITNLFADFTGALGTQAAAERAHTYGAPKPTYNTGLFGTPRGAVQVSQ